MSVKPYTPEDVKRECDNLLATHIPTPETIREINRRIVEQAIFPLAAGLIRVNVTDMGLNDLTLDSIMKLYRAYNWSVAVVRATDHRNEHYTAITFRSQ